MATPKQLEAAEKKRDEAMRKLALRPTLSTKRAACRAWAALGALYCEHIYASAKAMPAAERKRKVAAKDAKRGKPAASTPKPEPTYSAVPATHQIVRAFDALDDGRNFVPIAHLREATLLNREHFDKALAQLRRLWVFSADPAEGRHSKVPKALLDGGIREGRTNLVYLTRRDAEFDERALKAAELVAKDGLAYIDEVWAEYSAGDPDLSLEDFKRQLLTVALAGDVQLASADMAGRLGGADARHAQASELRRGPSVYHMVRV